MGSKGRGPLAGGSGDGVPRYPVGSMNISSLQRRFRPLLRPAAALYEAAMRLRASGYAKASEKNKAYRAACPVVSVGNIAWGGSGKTPIVGWLLDWAAQNALEAVVLTRGYKAAPPELPYPVRPYSDAASAGDEPLFLARKHPKALVIVDPKRRRSAAWAEENAAPHLFVLDDGMQHMDMGRDINLVLLRPDDLLTDWGQVIPAGPWREGASALARADAFCIKADPALLSALASAAELRLKTYGKPLFSFHLAPNGLSRLCENSGDPERISDLQGRDYALACAVGSPGQVQETAKNLLGKDPAVRKFFPDHHAFTAADAESLATQNLPVVCTGKDAVKLLPLLPRFGQTPVWVLEVALRFGPALFTNDTFESWWAGQWQRLTPGR